MLLQWSLRSSRSCAEQIPYCILTTGGHRLGTATIYRMFSIFFNEYKAFSGWTSWRHDLHLVQLENALHSLKEIQGHLQKVTSQSSDPLWSVCSGAAAWHRTWNIAVNMVIAAATTVNVSLQTWPSGIKYAYLHWFKLNQCKYAIKTIPAIQL